jgi:branched-chain amino acid aminotransferase
MAAIGEGIFETLKVVDSRALDLNLHVERLADAAARVGLISPDCDAVRAEVETHLSAHPVAFGRMRLTWLTTPTGAVLSIDSAATKRPAPTISLGVSAVTVDPDSPLAGLKTTAYLDNSVALQGARSAGYDDALLTTTSGLLAETSTANLFYVLEGQLRTPRLSTGCLPGIARGKVLEFSDAIEIDAPASVLAAATEVFVTSSLREVQPVSRVDQWSYPSVGPVTSAVMEAWGLGTQDENQATVR